MIEDAAPEIAPLAAGQVLDGKYRVGRALGGGAMGIVYEAYHLALQKAVAVKVLRPEFATNEEVRDRFEAEARAAAAIGHPNIVSVTDMGTTPAGAIYFVMDRLRGESMGERLKRAGKMDVASVARIALEVLSGLEAAHELRLVHRDLKPDNIFLARPPGGREIAKILDFGVAKALASVGRRAKETRVGMTVGTPLYMSPEQAIADPNLDGRADIYSMGVILYEALAGRVPFDGEDAVTVLKLAMSTDPTPLASLCREAPLAFVRVVEQAMARDRDHRPATAGEFAALVQEAVGGLVGTPAPVRSITASIDLKALEAPKLVDLTGNEIAAAPPAVIESADEDEYEDEDDDEDDAPRPAAQAAATYVMTAADRAAAAAAVAPAAPAPRRSLPKALWLAPLSVLAAAAWLLATQGGGDAEPAPAAPAPAARDTVLVQFEVTPPASKLYLDGVPVTTNPAPVDKGSMHTLHAEAAGYETDSNKFTAYQPTTVRLTLRPAKR